MADFTESFTSAVDGSFSDALVSTDLTWTIVEPDDWEVVSNQASPRGDIRGTTGYARAEHDTATADQYAQFEVHALIGPTSQGGPCVRYDPAANNSYMAMIDMGLGQVLLRRTDAGSRTTLAASAAVDITGLPKVLRVEVQGDTIRGFWDGVEVVSTTDATYQTQTRTGIYGHEDTGDDLGFIVDNFASGDLAAAPPGVTGDIAAQLPALTGALSAESVAEATLSGVLPGIQSGSTAHVTVTATLTGVLPALTAALTGEVAAPAVPVTGDVAASLPALEASLVGAGPVTGDIVATLPSLAAELEGERFIAPTTVNVRAHLDRGFMNACFPTRWPPV